VWIELGHWVSKSNVWIQRYFNNTDLPLAMDTALAQSSSLMMSGQLVVGWLMPMLPQKNIFGKNSLRNCEGPFFNQ
jgi:hypothetical protein